MEKEEDEQPEAAEKKDKGKEREKKQTMFFSITQNN